MNHTEAVFPFSDSVYTVKFINVSTDRHHHGSLWPHYFMTSYADQVLDLHEVAVQWNQFRGVDTSEGANNSA